MEDKKPKKSVEVPSAQDIFAGAQREIVISKDMPPLPGALPAGSAAAYHISANAVVRRAGVRVAELKPFFGKGTGSLFFWAYEGKIYCEDEREGCPESQRLTCMDVVTAIQRMISVREMLLEGIEDKGAVISEINSRVRAFLEDAAAVCKQGLAGVLEQEYRCRLQAAQQRAKVCKQLKDAPANPRYVKEEDQLKRMSITGR